MRLKEIIMEFTLDFYKLLRGFLDHNLGEQLTPDPETIPFELLQLPEICVCIQ